MSSKELFNTEKEDSIDKSTPSVLPKYKFEHSKDRKPNSFSADQWFVEN